MPRVMLIDEDIERRETVRYALESCGHEIVGEATSTVDLHDLVSKAQPDVIIIDTDSPGRDTLEHICCMTRNQPRPIVMFTHDGENEKIKAALQAGVSSYVVDGLNLDRIQPILDVAITHFESFQELKNDLAKAQNSLEERKFIERAKGILMEQRKISEDEAYHSLRKIAMGRNQKLADVAKQIVSVAEMLGKG